MDDQMERISAASSVEEKMSGTSFDTKFQVVNGPAGSVTFVSQDGQMLTVPARFLPIVNPAQRTNRFQDEKSGLTAGLLTAVHAIVNGGKQQSAIAMMDDEYHRCGNEPHYVGPRPHWTDMLSALAEYGASLPAKSGQRNAAFVLCRILIDEEAQSARQ